MTDDDSPTPVDLCSGSVYSLVIFDCILQVTLIVFSSSRKFSCNQGTPPWRRLEALDLRVIDTIGPPKNGENRDRYLQLGTRL